MRTPLHSLAWKEWHEHKWKLASILAVLIGITEITVFADDRHELGLAHGLLLMCVVPLAVFIGLGAAANERSRNTLPFLQSLPVPMTHVAQMKLMMAVLTVIVPIVVTTLSLYLWRVTFDALGVEYRDPIDELRTCLFAAGISVSLFLWSAAIGVNRKDEVSAGAVVLAVLVGWAAVLILVTSSTFPGQTPVSWPVAIALSTAPAGMAFGLETFNLSAEQTRVGLLVAVVVHLILAASYIRRFGQIANAEIRSPQIARPAKGTYEWLAPPRSSPLTAIAWKQFRESGPIAAAGMAGIAGIVLLMFTVQGSGIRPFDTYFAVSATFGAGIALVIGIGVVLHDLGPQLNTFWRSRPVNPDMWFWVKFASGLGIVLATVYVPLLIIAALYDTATYQISYPDLLVFPAMHVAMFAAAVATTCLVRQAIYAAILSMAITYLFVVGMWGILFAAGKLGVIQNAPTQMGQMSEFQVIAGLIGCFAACTLVAWLAVRYDWGRKGRY